MERLRIELAGEPKDLVFPNPPMPDRTPVADREILEIEVLRHVSPSWSRTLPPKPTP
jgi:hypothetical protein